MPDELGMTATTEGAGETADLQATKDTARSIASVMADKMASDRAASAAPAATTTTDVSAPVEPAAGSADGYSADDITEMERVMAEAGIDIGITAADVPDELKPKYVKILQSVVNTAETVLAQQLEASAALQQVAEFRSRLEKSPDRLLLAIALQRPDDFKKAIQVYEEMQQDSRVKDLVTRELETEVRLQEVDRRDKLSHEREQRMKAQRVIYATKQASRKYGVDYGLAEKFVAMAIQGNSGDIDPNNVDGIVKELRKEPIRVKPAAVSPAAAAAARGAPTESVASATDQSRLSPSLKEGERTKSGGGFRSLVQNAFRKLQPKE